jgi:squalene-hopene/tetraprenyl-beta-curcumene cyclase
MSNWSRSMLVPLAIINHFKPTRPAQHANAGRAFPLGLSRARFDAGPRSPTISLAQFLPLAGQAAQIRRTSPSMKIHPFRKLA